MSEIQFHKKTILGEQKKKEEEKLKLVLWRIYLNTNKYNFELKHVFKNN